MLRQEIESCLFYFKQMKFIDLVTIDIQAGNGGRGCVSFRREKFIPRGGPDGGDGGRGGHVVFKATNHLNTLLDLKFNPINKAKNGQHGMGKAMRGKDGEDLTITIPVGTLVKDAFTNESLEDFTHDGQQAIMAHGGRGGLGNVHFKTSTRQAPRFAQPGESGENKRLILELKVLADVGLVGLPNAGKSTLISIVSACKPKIADYPFTTLIPNLGVVKYADYMSFVIADIPGLIKDAHQGAGLGFQFLRHIERTAILLFLVDISDYTLDDPVESLKILLNEISLYKHELGDKKKFVAGTKLDINQNSEKIETLARYCHNHALPFFPLSSATGQGVQSLIAALAAEVAILKGQ
jgi:GTP-binding protein